MRIYLPFFARRKAGDDLTVLEDPQITDSLDFVGWTRIQRHGASSGDARPRAHTARNDFHRQRVTVHQADVVPRGGIGRR